LPNLFNVIQSWQADVEIEFELPSFIGAEPFDASWTVDPAELCRDKGADVDGGIGPFGLLVLASDNLVEHTAVYFRVFKSEGRSYVVLMCTDQRRYV
jgi:beta-fructofuranosidase